MLHFKFIRNVIGPFIRFMRKKKKERLYWQRRFGNLTAEDMAPYYHHLDLRRFWDLDDEGLAYLMTNVKGVIMLDLNESAITNESIKLLTDALKNLPHLAHVSLVIRGCLEVSYNVVKNLEKALKRQKLSLELNHDKF